MLQSALMLGGGKKVKSLLNGESGMNPVAVMAVLVVLFLLRALVVQLAYNKVAPKLISNWGHHEDKEFKPLTFEEALLFTILISFLFI
tara:strand:- start:195 stop:458 length:264 start_codon:yes stop_codon:yes gene_type:complete